MRLDSTLKKVVPDISRPTNFDTILVSVQLADTFQIREHSWMRLFHISEHRELYSNMGMQHTVGIA